MNIYLSRLDAVFTESFIIDVAGRGTISIRNSRAPLSVTIDELHFADGTVKSFSEFDVTYLGSNESGSIQTGHNFTGDVTIYGFDGDDSLRAQDANASFYRVYGGLGDDTLHAYLHVPSLLDGGLGMILFTEGVAIIVIISAKVMMQYRTPLAVLIKLYFQRGMG